MIGMRPGSIGQIGLGNNAEIVRKLRQAATPTPTPTPTPTSATFGSTTTNWGDSSALFGSTN